jgi:hypothetical protein
MRSLYVVTLVVALAACDRSGKTGHTPFVTAAPPAPASVGENPPSAAHVARKPHSAQTVHRKQSLAGSSTSENRVTRRSEDLGSRDGSDESDFCAGLTGDSLDQCIAENDSGQGNPSYYDDSRALNGDRPDQSLHDRDLLDQDAEEAAAIARDREREREGELAGDPEQQDQQDFPPPDENIYNDDPYNGDDNVGDEPPVEDEDEYGR